MSARALALVVLAACTRPPELLAPLPPPAPIDTPRFASVVVCDRCHTAGTTAMRDAAGADISPVRDAAAAMMSLAARDPYYLAALRRELLANPGAKRAIESVCIRCHAPVGFAESAGALTLDELTASTSPAAALGREGVGCAGCHSLDPAGLGDEATVTGKHALRGDRVSYGALPAPLAEAMLAMANTRPVPSPHVTESRLCASCHTVLVRRLDARGEPVGDEIPEQTTFLEWRAASYPRTCQDCHMPATGAPTAFSTRPPDAPARTGYRRHTLLGGNAYMLERMAAAAAWLGVPLADGAARATRAFVTTAARLDLARTGDALTITVVNLTGHKLPTGYPTRRMWLEVTVPGAFVSGRTDGRGAIVDGSGRRLDGPGAILPHVQRIRSAADVAIWEAVPVDDHGKRTHLLLGTAAIAKDDRILPAGWRADAPDARRTRPTGVDGDPDFAPGRDGVVVELPPGTRGVRVRLLYQPVPPETIDSYRATDSREAARFLAIVREPPTPIELATATE